MTKWEHWAGREFARGGQVVARLALAGIQGQTISPYELDQLANRIVALLNAAEPGGALSIAEAGLQELCNDQDPANECWNTLRAIQALVQR